VMKLASSLPHPAPALVAQIQKSAGATQRILQWLASSRILDH